MHSLYQRRFDTGETGWVCDLGSTATLGGGFAIDVARRRDRLAMPLKARGCLRVMDLDRPGIWVHEHHVRNEATLDDLCSISADGNRLLYGEIWEDHRSAMELDLTTGRVRELFSKNWKADHIHYCPHDENWVVFCHGISAETPDRCWVWHEQQAPAGKVVFDQASAVPGRPLLVGHECWTHHDNSAYAISPGELRGLYEVFADGRPARCLWESDVLWHCNMDPTGRYAVVDTTGPFTNRKLSREEFERYVKRHLDTGCAGGETSSDVVLLDLQTRQSLVLATPWRTRHSYHPHPAISPDAQWIAWNDSRPAGAWLARVEYIELPPLTQQARHQSPLTFEQSLIHNLNY
jgi:hypothetical protein